MDNNTILTPLRKTAVEEPLHIKTQETISIRNTQLLKTTNSYAVRLFEESLFQFVNYFPEFIFILRRRNTVELNCPLYY